MSHDDLPDVEVLEAQIEQLHHDCLNASAEAAYLRDANERMHQTARLADEQAQQRIRELEDSYAAVSKRLDEWRELADARAAENDGLRAVVEAARELTAAQVGSVRENRAYNSLVAALRALGVTGEAT